MKPLYFGDSKQPLFGIYHPPAVRPGRRTAVLLCNPFGHEAIFAHRIFRVMADRLAGTGFHVLRFDYYATGDSGGDCRDATLARWLDDVATASDELADMSGVAGMAWIGLRLGATVAALASARRRTPVSSLVLWEPVVDGVGYLDELRLAHLALLAEDLEFPPPHPFTSATARSITIDQAVGFAIPPPLEQEIRALDAARVSTRRAGKVSVVAGLKTGEVEALRVCLGERGEQVSWHTPQQSEVWNSERALNSAVLPVAAMNEVIACLEGCR